VSGRWIVVAGLIALAIAAVIILTGWEIWVSLRAEPEFLCIEVKGGHVWLSDLGPDHPRLLERITIRSYADGDCPAGGRPLKASVVVGGGR
jgi:hypothetical protein